MFCVNGLGNPKQRHVCSQYRRSEVTAKADDFLEKKAINFIEIEL